MQKTVKKDDVIIVKDYINVKNEKGFHQGMKIKVGSIDNRNGNIVGHKIQPSTISGVNKKGELVLTHTKDILAYGS
tara:strand:+ start:1898 stop:2125 length:228 start_codon:yes stop_codon:yes gene_type:complete